MSKWIPCPFDEKIQSCRIYQEEGKEGCIEVHCPVYFYTEHRKDPKEEGHEHERDRN